MPVRLPSYIYRNRWGIFYFRVVVPLALTVPGTQREFRLSLQTPERTAAIREARYLAYRIAELFAAITEMGKKKQKSTPTASLTGPAGFTPDQFKLWLNSERVKFRAIQRVEELEELLQQERTAHRKQQAAFVEKARGVVKQAFAQGILRGHRAGAGKEPIIAAPTPSPLISQVIEDFGRHKAAKGSWTPKTREENLVALKLFERIVGDIPIADVTDEKVMSYVETLKMLPPNMTKRYPGLPIAEVLVTHPKPISARTFNKNIERVSSLFKWAKNRPKYCLTYNPAAGLSVEEEGVARRQPFTRAELIALFSSPEFNRREFQNLYAYWLMPLALFTGARQGELTQLYVKDVVDVEGVPCLNITDAEEGQKLKNPNAKRLVPIHSLLIKIGFLRYVDSLRATGIDRIFPELNLRRDGFGHATSNWFQRYKARCGIKAKHTKVFHSFRHNFISHLLDEGVAEHLVAKLVGHEAELITGKVYWNASDARKRQPIVEKFTLPDEVTQLIPKFEDIRLVARRGRSRTIS